MVVKRIHSLVVVVEVVVVIVEVAVEVGLSFVAVVLYSPGDLGMHAELWLLVVVVAAVAAFAVAAVVVGIAHSHYQCPDVLQDSNWTIEEHHANRPTWLRLMLHQK